MQGVGVERGCAVGFGVGVGFRVGGVMGGDLDFGKMNPGMEVEMNMMKRNGSREGGRCNDNNDRGCN